jgi:hypothetical protein
MRETTTSTLTNEHLMVRQDVQKRQDVFNCEKAPKALTVKRRTACAIDTNEGLKRWVREDE